MIIIYALEFTEKICTKVLSSPFMLLTELGNKFNHGVDQQFLSNLTNHLSNHESFYEIFIDIKGLGYFLKELIFEKKESNSAKYYYQKEVAPVDNSTLFFDNLKVQSKKLQKGVSFQKNFSSEKQSGLLKNFK